MSRNIAVIGTGYWGKNLVRNFHALGALHSICDANEDVLQGFIDSYRDVRGFSSFSDILGNPQIKGVAIASPAETHFALAREVMLAGKDVYVEKPLCLEVADGLELTRLAEERKRVLMTGHLLWYHPAIQRLKKMIHEGELGRIHYVYSNRLNLGKLRREENVLWSFAPHDISTILGLLEEMPATIQAQGGNYLHQQIADTTVTLLEFPSGVKAHIFVSWLHPFKEQKLVVVGSHKMAVFDDTAPWERKLVIYPHSVEWNDNIPIAHKAESQAVPIEEREPLHEECRHFLECMANRKQPRTDGREGLKVLRVLRSCQDALESGSRVKISKPELSSTDKRDVMVHATAIVDSDVAIGKGTKIWHFSHITIGAKIGEDCTIGQNVVIGSGVRIGNGCKIQNNVSIYTGVELEDHVFCGPSMVFTNVFNPRCEFPRKDEYKQTLVRRGATIGANATIVCGVTLGEYAFVGAGAVVTTDVKPFALVMGNPARQVGWLSRFGKRLDLPLCGDGEIVCGYTGDQYRLEDGTVRIVSCPTNLHVLPFEGKS